MTAPTDPRAANEEISLIAYEIWEAEGRPDGRDRAHWFLAKELVGGGDNVHGEAAASSDSDNSETARPLQPGFDDPAGDESGDEASRQLDRRKEHTHIRPAGRKKMDLPPSTWSKTDEEVDESFPASDPPGNY